MLRLELLSFLILFDMTTKNKLFLGLSIATFLAVLVSILTSETTNETFDASLPIYWILLLLFAFILPIFNLAEIIINRDDWNKFYWIALLLNIITLFFIMRFFTVEFDFVKMFQN
jgi:uncharacterized membrane protein